MLASKRKIMKILSKTCIKLEIIPEGNNCRFHQYGNFDLESALLTPLKGISILQPVCCHLALLNLQGIKLFDFLYAQKAVV